MRAARLTSQNAVRPAGTGGGVSVRIVALLALDWVTGQVVAADGGVSLASPIDPVDGPMRRTR